MGKLEAEALDVVVVGLGYVGVTAAACIASAGHRVTGIDVSEEKVAAIASGKSPITEPGVEELIANAVAAGRLHAAQQLPSLDDCDVVLVCVGTPSAPDGSHNMGYIVEASRQIAARIGEGSGESVTVAYRSTFRPGTTEMLIAPLFEEVLGNDFASRVELVYNPEFLRESTAVSDYFAPPKIVLGTAGSRPSARMRRLHEGIEAATFEVGYREAEVTKFVDNSWHAVKVAFANEVGRICAAYGVAADVAHSIFVADTKLNISPYYTRPGGAFGGSCLPKDVRAMQSIARTAGVEVQLIDSLISSNEAHKSFQLERVRGSVPQGGSILVAGLAFKAGTDDLRESPNVTLVADLIAEGFLVEVFDPDVQHSTLVGQNLGYVLNLLPNLRGILVSAEEAHARKYDLIVANNAWGSALADHPSPRLDLHRISA
jgi:GDP-mannose 6-dehydrogenase